MSDRRLAEAERAYRAEPNCFARAAVERERKRAGLCFKCGERPAAPLIHPRLLSEDLGDDRVCCCADCHEEDWDREGFGIMHLPCPDCPHLGNLGVKPGPPRRAAPPDSPHACPSAPGEPHDIAAEFHYVDVGVGYVAGALLDVWCKRCEEHLEFCSTCGALYGLPREGCNGCGPAQPEAHPYEEDMALRRRPTGPVCNGAIAAAWCAACGDCCCPPHEDLAEEKDLNDPSCPLHSPVSPHGVAVSEEHEASEFWRGR